MFGIGPIELLMILVVALLVFGPKRVPELARNLGRGLAEFRRASNDLRQSLALDDLQRDLRRDLSGQPTVHRPEDRPAQAGDDLPPGGATQPAPADRSAPETDAKHPGELPPGNDHAHHDSEDTDDTDDTEDRDDREDDADAPGAAAKSPADPPAASGADPGLGNVPVSDPKPADRRG